MSYRMCISIPDEVHTQMEDKEYSDVNWSQVAAQAFMRKMGATVVDVEEELKSLRRRVRELERKAGISVATVKPAVATGKRKAG